MAARKLDDAVSGTSIAKEAKVLHGNISEDGALKYDFMTSLENISVAKIVRNLWMDQSTQQEIVNLFHNYVGKPRSNDFNGKWKQICDCVVTRISELPLATSIAEKLINAVPILGRSILEWIDCYECIFDNAEYYSVYLINNIKWTARGKIYHADTARNLLANKDSRLTDDHKYKIACNFCLEDEIAILAPEVVNRDYLKNVDIYRCPMVHFWTGRITGDNSTLYRASRHPIFNENLPIESINERIFKLLAGDFSHSRGTFADVPLRYMWNELSEEEKAKNASLILKLGSPELIYSLLSNLNYEQQQKTFKTCNLKTFENLFNDWLWGHYFLPTALRVLDVIQPVSFFCLLYVLIHKKDKNYEQENIHHSKDKSLFKLLWDTCPKHLKDDFLEQKCEVLLHKLATSLLTRKQDVDLIELVFKDLNADQKKNIIFGRMGIDYCSRLIKNSQWDLLELFISHTLSSADDEILLYEKVINEKGQEIWDFLVEKKSILETGLYHSLAI